MKNHWIFSHRTFFFLLPFIYFFLYGRYGLDDIDGGYTLSSAYRIINGQVPYRDFILVRPPLFLYLHALPLLIIPPAFQMIVNRLTAYLTFAFTSWLSVEIIRKHFDLENYKIDTYLLSSIIFIFSVHNFPPMTWHTTDGILFGVIGIYFLSVHPTLFRTFAGMLFLVAAALIKQSFYPMPLAGLFYVFLTQPVRGVLAGFFSLVLIVSGICFMASSVHLLEPFISWTTGSTHVRDALDAGLWSYINVHIVKIPLICLLLFIAIQFAMKKYQKTLVENGWALVLYVTVVFISILYRSRADEPIHFQTRYPQLFLLITAAGIILYLFRRGKNPGVLTLGFLLILAWCASISWGYRTPLLFSAPLIFGIIWVTKELLNFRHIRVLCYLLLTGGLVCFYFANDPAYYDGKRKDLVYDMGSVFPKLSFVKSDKETYLKYTELKSLVKQYGNNFKTLPGVLLANYLTDTDPPIGIDWALDLEINNRADVAIDQLNKSNCYAFVEKNPVLKIDSKWSSAITAYVTAHWIKVGEGDYFTIYHKS